MSLAQIRALHDYLLVRIEIKKMVQNAVVFPIDVCVSTQKLLSKYKTYIAPKTVEESGRVGCTIDSDGL